MDFCKLFRHRQHFSMLGACIVGILYSDCTWYLNTNVNTIVIHHRRWMPRPWATWDLRTTFIRSTNSETLLINMSTWRRAWTAKLGQLSLTVTAAHMIATKAPETGEKGKLSITCSIFVYNVECMLCLRRMDAISLRAVAIAHALFSWFSNCLHA